MYLEKLTMLISHNYCKRLLLKKRTCKKKGLQKTALEDMAILAIGVTPDTKAVRKNVSLPAWMVNLADKRGINCSKVLQDALLTILS